MCAIAVENGTAELHEKYLKLKLRIGFVKKGDAIVHDNSSIHVDGDSTELKEACRSLGIGITNLPANSPELNPTELVFNIMVQSFSYRFNESSTWADEKNVQLLHSAVDSVTPNVLFSCYEKCGCLHFQIVIDFSIPLMRFFLF